MRRSPMTSPRPRPKCSASRPALASRFRPGQIGDIARLFDVCRAEKIDAIVHAAGMVGLEPSLAQPLATYQTNIMGLVNVCEAARQFGMRKLISISSNAAYHKGAGGALRRDRSAVLGDRRQSGRALRHLEDGGRSDRHGLCEIPGGGFLALRITAIYGFGMRIADVHQADGRERGARPADAVCTGGPMKRDYTHVLDCCDAIVLALDAPTWPQGPARSSVGTRNRACRNRAARFRRRRRTG